MKLCGVHTCPSPAAAPDPLCVPHGRAASARAAYEHAAMTSRVRRSERAKFERAVAALMAVGAPIPERWLDGP